tara:strand:- start:71 stop:328 length:258 start_codon:yes stop_codon:yes gene_type:complete
MIKQEVTKITDQELDSVKKLQEEQSVLINNVGNFEYQSKFFLDKKDQALEELKSIDSKIQNISEELKKKYGDVVINTQTGEIIKE